MDYRDHCRICLGKGLEMRHVNSTIAISGEDIRLSDILRDFYDYEVTPEEWYPENICINCVHHLTLTHSFKLLIESSTKTLAINTLLGETSDNNECDFDFDNSSTIQMYSNEMRQFKRMRPKIIIQRSSELERQLFCVECKAEFSTNKTLLEHCTINHPAKSVTGRDCEYCNEKIDDFKELVVHRKLHMKPYLCLTCWAGFYIESDYNAHTCQPHPIRDHNPKILRQCDQCGKSYPQGYIKVHMMTHGNDRRYSCKYCPKKFKVANGLNSHVLWNHKRTRNHKCEVCDATFISASARSSHIRKNHLKEKKYGCENCAKRFFSKSELQRHMLTHTGVKNFHCHLCDKSYQTRYGLNVHLKSHAQISINDLNM